MKKYNLLSAFFLATTCFVGSPAISMDGEKIDKSKVVERKMNQKMAEYRLSNKGDLPCYATNYHITGNYDQYRVKPNRRPFYTIGDGDCFFWATDLKRQDAVALLLQNSGNEEIRALASEEIFDSFEDEIREERRLRQRVQQAFALLGQNNPLGELESTQLVDASLQLHQALQKQNLHKIFNLDKTRYRPLPEAIRINPLFKKFKGFWNDIKDLLEDQNIVGDDRHAYEQALDVILDEIRNEYCLNENIYRDYVSHCLSKRHQYMQSAVGDNRTYFVDALAHLRNKNLIVWEPRSVDKATGEITSLAKSHEYIKQLALDTWEVILCGSHYTRVVPTDNPAALARALKRETEYILASYNIVEKEDPQQPVKPTNPAQARQQPAKKPAATVNQPVKALQIANGAKPAMPDKPAQAAQQPVKKPAAMTAKPAKALKKVKAAKPAKALKKVKAAKPAQPALVAKKPAVAVQPAKALKKVNGTKLVTPVQLTPVAKQTTAKPQVAAVPRLLAVAQPAKGKKFNAAKLGKIQKGKLVNTPKSKSTQALKPAPLKTSKAKLAKNSKNKSTKNLKNKFLNNSKKKLLKNIKNKPVAPKKVFLNASKRHKKISSK